MKPLTHIITAMHTLHTVASFSSIGRRALSHKVYRNATPLLVATSFVSQKNAIAATKDSPLSVHRTFGLSTSLGMVDEKTEKIKSWTFDFEDLSDVRMFLN